jgi:ribonuclease HII
MLHRNRRPELAALGIYGHHVTNKPPRRHTTSSLTKERIDINTAFVNISIMSKILEPFYSDDTLEVGIDEAGRGPLFGRIYVGAAILPPDDSFNHSLMRDSKKLSERKRLIAYDYIRDFAIDYNTYYLDEKAIDKINIYKATQQAMHKVIDGLIVSPQHILVDGSTFPVYFRDNRIIPHVCIEGGDDKYTAIAAASILAKVERDKYIHSLCDEYENLDEFYSLRSNKGYGTAAHIEGIKKYGITQWHRRTFGICKNYP